MKQQFFTILKRLFTNTFFILFLLLLISATINNFYSKNKTTVLGANYHSAQIYLYGGRESFAQGGVVSLASTDEPAIYFGSYNVSGTAEVMLYKANDDAVLDYLTHDDKGYQTKKKPDKNKLTFITKTKVTIDRSDKENAKILLPLEEKGIWYVDLKINGLNVDAFIVRSTIASLVREGDDQFVFWGQSFKTKKSINDGVAILYNLENGRREIERASFGSDGIAKAKLTKDADIALIAQNDERAIIPINLQFLNSSYTYKPFHEKSKVTRYFIFTDKPLYLPGDTVHFKAVLRDDDDARYAVPQGDVTVRLYFGGYYSGSENKPIYENKYGVSADGTISGEYTLPKDSKVGYYSLTMMLGDQQEVPYYYNWSGDYAVNSINFNVEYYKKPEYNLEVKLDKNEVISGDKATFTIKGAYFSGQPLLNQKVQYTVSSNEFYEYEYLADQQYIKRMLTDYSGYSYAYDGQKEIVKGTATLDKKGEAVIDLDTDIAFSKGKSRVFIISASMVDRSQTPSFDSKNMLIRAGEFDIYRNSYSYNSRVKNKLSLPIVLHANGENSKISEIKLTAKVHNERWIEQKEKNKKYPTYKKIEKDFPDISAITDTNGKAELSFVPTETGSYKISVEAKDARNNVVSKVLYTYVTADDEPYYYGEHSIKDLTVTTDKKKYLPNETVKLTLSSYLPGRDVFVSLDRGRMDRYQIVHMEGKTKTIEIPLKNTDMPNMFAMVSSFDDNSLNTNSTNILVSAESKQLMVKLSPNSRKFGPGDTVTVDISTTDISGNPISADLALWTIDKALYELKNTNVGDIFNTFWFERSFNTQGSHSLVGIRVDIGGRGGGCFAAGTKVLMADGSQKNIEDVKSGEYILTRTESDGRLQKAKVTKTEAITEAGYLIINRNLKVTANHYLWVNSSWKTAGDIQIGDVLVNNQGKKVAVTSLEWQNVKAQVYNLEVEKYHTYFAGGVWVHNQKEAAREDFKDIAYWNPSIRTNIDGKAQVSFKLPDNLTTWVLTAVASTTNTQVGQTTSDIRVTKDVIVRPILPNILRTGDQVVLSNLVQNFTDTDHTFGVNFSFDSGDIIGPKQQDTFINTNDMQQLYWHISPNKENEKAKLTFAAKAADNEKMEDTIIQEIPVVPFVFEEKTAETGIGSKDFTVKLYPDSSREKTKVTLSFAPTIIGTLPTAINYLLQYPYGCVEQTTSRFVPVVIARSNPELFAAMLSGKDTDEMMKKGVDRLTSLQHYSGGWSWWVYEKADPFISVYVVDYLLKAKELGVKMDENILERAHAYFKDAKLFTTREDTVFRMYGLTLFGDKGMVEPVSNLNGLTPDTVAFAVMTNYLNGDKNPKTNGLEKLINMAYKEGDMLYWGAGYGDNFGSVDASTAFAVRAILLAGGDRTLAVQGIRYLTNKRKAEYWSNTFGTAQVLRAFAEFAKTGQELKPDYTYSVKIDGKQIAAGSVTDPKQTVVVSVPTDTVKSAGSKVSLAKKGNGQMYSLLFVDELRTDRKAKADSNGISITREYVNEKGEEYSLGVGDTATIKLTVSGLSHNNYYGVISDKLPAGMVPINETLLNEQYDKNSRYYGSSKEITQEGANLFLYRFNSGSMTYEYRARVVSAGTFIAPPATVSMMYAPEIYARSDVQTVIIDSESKYHPLKAAQIALTENPNLQRQVIVTAIVVFLFVIGVFLNRRKIVAMEIGKEKEKKE